MAKYTDVYKYAGSGQEVEGIYKGYRKSFGFVIMPDGIDDIYVSVENKGSAMHNDKVRVRILGSTAGNQKKECKSCVFGYSDGRNDGFGSNEHH